MARPQNFARQLRALGTRVRLLHPLRRLMGERLDHLHASSLEDRFAHIYRTRLWALGDADTPGSGSGSSLSATTNVRGALPGLLQKIGAGTLLDVGCGDYHWMRTVDLGDVDYVGVDIVPHVIEANARDYASPRVRFLQLNAVSDPLPEADTVLIREVLFHLSFADAQALLRNVLATPRRHLLITTDTDVAINLDIQSGDWRLLNLQAAPFKFPPPDHAIVESGRSGQRRLAVWSAAALRPLVG